MLCLLISSLLFWISAAILSRCCALSRSVFASSSAAACQIGLSDCEYLLNLPMKSSNCSTRAARFSKDLFWSSGLYRCRVLSNEINHIRYSADPYLEKLFRRRGDPYHKCRTANAHDASTVPNFVSKVSEQQIVVGRYASSILTHRPARDMSRDV